MFTKQFDMRDMSVVSSRFAKPVEDTFPSVLVKLMTSIGSTGYDINFSLICRRLRSMTYAERIDAMIVIRHLCVSKTAVRCINNVLMRATPKFIIDLRAQSMYRLLMEFHAKHKNATATRIVAINYMFRTYEDLERHKRLNYVTICGARALFAMLSTCFKASDKKTICKRMAEADAVPEHIMRDVQVFSERFAKPV
jgi:hypothetical protein